MKIKGMHAAFVCRVGAFFALSAMALLSAAPGASASTRLDWRVGGGFRDGGPFGQYFAKESLDGAAAFTRRDMRIDFDWGSTSNPHRPWPGDGAGAGGRKSNLLAVFEIGVQDEGCGNEWCPNHYDGGLPLDSSALHAQIVMTPKCYGSGLWAGCVHRRGEVGGFAVQDRHDGCGEDGNDYADAAGECGASVI